MNFSCDRRALPALCFLFSFACGEPASEPGAASGGQTGSGGAVSGTGGTLSGAGGANNSGGSPGSGGDAQVALDAPDEATALLAFLEAKSYSSWKQEPEYHNPSGPHGDGVKVFYSPKAESSLTGGPLSLGGAIVKELTSGGSLYGWGVYVQGKDLPGTEGIYFYELIKPSTVYGDAYDTSECTGCRQSGQILLNDPSLVLP